jgi:hypothetical protein
MPPTRVQAWQNLSKSMSDRPGSASAFLLAMPHPVGYTPFNANPVMPKNVADSWSLFRTVSKEMPGSLFVLRLHAEFALTFSSFDCGGASSGFERGAAKRLRL